MARRTSASRRSGDRGVFRTPSRVYWQRRRSAPLPRTAGLYLFPPGVDSAEAVGVGSVSPGNVNLSPPGVPSAEAVGVGQVLRDALFPPGVDSAEAVGTGSVAPGNVNLYPAGVDTAEQVGTGSLTITIDLARLQRVATGVHGNQRTYELMVVARIPSAGGPPTFLEVDPIEWTKLSWSDTLSQPQALSASAMVSSLPESVKQRLRTPDRLATELWLRRDGQIMFAGPLRTWRRTGGEVEITADGLLAYLDRMVVWYDLRFDQIDQFAIVKALVDQWQTGLAHGHYGIDTSAVGVSGKLRDRTYARNEQHKIGQRVEELGKVIDGFDTEIDPETRKLQLWYPSKGVDRSSGADAVIFDDRNVTSADVMCSVAPEDLASYAFGVATSSGADEALWSAYYTAELAAAYGAGAVMGSWSDVKEQTTLDEHTVALLRSRDHALLVPGPKTWVTPDADLSAYSEGDTVRFEMDSALGVTGAFRVRKRTVEVERTGKESVGLEFV